MNLKTLEQVHRLLFEELEHDNSPSLVLCSMLVNQLLVDMLRERTV